MILRNYSLVVRRSVGSGFLFDPRFRTRISFRATTPSCVENALPTRAIRRRAFTTAKDTHKQKQRTATAVDGWRAAWNRFLAPKPMPPRNTLAWYKEMALICTVFAVTGTSTMVVRFLCG
jgi:hypothetical protein